MTKSMESNTEALYLRKSTEDDGKSVAAKERTVSPGVPSINCQARQTRAHPVNTHLSGLTVSKSVGS